MEENFRFQELYDGFEDKQLSDIWSHRRFEERSVEIQSAIFRKGKSAVKITIHKGDKIEHGKGKTSERDELLEEKKFSPHEGEEYIYSFSIYLPKDFPIVPTRLVLAQWKQDEKNEKVSVINPILALRYVGGKLFITLQVGDLSERVKLFRTKEEVRGKWFDFTFNLKFSRTKTGFVKVSMNKKKIINYHGITAYSKKYGYSKPGKFFFKMGLYRDQMEEPMTIYIDEFRKKYVSKK